MKHSFVYIHVKSHVLNKDSQKSQLKVDPATSPHTEAVLEFHEGEHERAEMRQEELFLKSTLPGA